MKKLFVFFVLSLWSIAGWAQNYNFSAVSPSGHTLYYKIRSTTDGTTVAIVPPTTSNDDPWGSFTKPTGDLIIPNTVQDENGNSYPVDIMISRVFKGCSGLNSVTILNGVTTIDALAFEDCTGLTSVTIPNSVIEIMDQTFSGCSSLTSVVIPNSVIEIMDQTFSGCTGLTSVTIPNSVTSIGYEAFKGCSSLTSVVIPNSVTSIGDMAFVNCSGLVSVVIGSSVTNISSKAFQKCSHLKTVFWFAAGTPSALVFKDTYMSNYDTKPDRMIFPGYILTSGSGDNTIYYVDVDLFFLVDDENDNTFEHIPYSALPTNFICRNGVGGPLVAREIVLTDGEDAFATRGNNNYAFTADSVTYTRSFTNGNRSTLCLPFSAAVPEGLEVYEFSNYDNSTHTLNFAPVADSIRAYTPYLVGYGLSKAEQTTCTITATDAFFPATIEENLHLASSNGMTFQGTMERTCMNGNNYGYSNGYFVQSGNGSDHDGHAHVNPFRCYFTYNPAAGAPQTLPATLFIDCSDNSPMGIGDVETPDRQNSIRYSNDVYDLMGRLVRKNAETLEGLPKGVYIWRGKKVLQFQ